MKTVLYHVGLCISLFLMLQTHVSTAFGINGIPTLILLEAETGDIINSGARMNVMQDPTGANFPWRE